MVEVVVAVVVLALVVLACGVGVAVRSQRRLGGGGARPRIDPFTIGEPWRHVIAAALRSRQQAARAVAAVPVGPLRDRLHTIEGGLDEALDECWAIARRGHELRKAITAMDLEGARSQLGTLGPRLPAAPPVPGLPSSSTAPDVVPALPPPGATELTAEELTAEARALDETTPEAAAARTAEALEAKLQAGDRLRRATSLAEDHLRLLGARLDEASARIIELAARPGDATTELSHLGGDVESLVQELEAVRQGLEAVGG